MKNLDQVIDFLFEAGMLAKTPRSGSFFLGSGKSYFLRYLFEKGYLTPESKILDMGSGTSNPWRDIFQGYSDINYTAIEPNQKSLSEAKKNFGGLPNKVFYNDFAYKEIKGFGQFDSCISLSALEHIKHLDQMLQKSVESVKSGGTIFHWYDLGHALHPYSLKERLQIFLGNNLPFLLSERNFVRYLCPDEVKNILEKYGAEVFLVSNHQARNIKACLKVAESPDEYNSISKLSEWEFENQDLIQKIDKNNRERFFPSIVIWARKKEKPSTGY